MVNVKPWVRTISYYRCGTSFYERGILYTYPKVFVNIGGLTSIQNPLPVAIMRAGSVNYLLSLRFYGKCGDGGTIVAVQTNSAISVIRMQIEVFRKGPFLACSQ